MLGGAAVYRRDKRPFQSCKVCVCRSGQIHRTEINSVILSVICLARSERQMESKDPSTAASFTAAARHSPCGPYRGVVRMPRIAIATPGRHGVLRLRECSASRRVHSAQDDKVGLTSEDRT